MCRGGRAPHIDGAAGVLDDRNGKALANSILGGKADAEVEREAGHGNS